MYFHLRFTVRFSCHILHYNSDPLVLEKKNKKTEKNMQNYTRKPNFLATDEPRFSQAKVTDVLKQGNECFLAVSTFEAAANRYFIAKVDDVILMKK